MLRILPLPPIIGTEPFCDIGRIAVNGKVVLTTAQVAEFYGCDVNNLHLNFFNAQKKGRFIEGKHYFKFRQGKD